LDKDGDTSIKISHNLKRISALNAEMAKIKVAGLPSAVALLPPVLFDLDTPQSVAGSTAMA